MRIFLLSIFLFFSVAFNSLKAQVYPDLNASTGNEEQYIVDADTNVYMYHGNQIEKVDKNFNPIWVKTYSGLLFHNLLLSKTGSLYFISENPSDYSRGILGKIKSDGNIDWCKSYSNTQLVTSFGVYTAPDCSFYKLILDRNNHLIFSGSANAASNSYERACLFLKTDTLGNVIVFKNFSQGGTAYNKFTVLDDSSGVYRFIWDAGYFENSGAGIFSYSEPLDSILKQYVYTFLPQFSSITQSVFLKSKLDTNCFYSINQWSPNMMAGQHNFLITKHYKDTITWIKQITINVLSNYLVSSIDEDGDKNLLFTTSPVGNTYYNNQYFKFDSIGVGNQSKILLSYSLPWGPGNYMITSKLNVLYGKHYFYDVYGFNFPANPLSVTLLDSTLTANCAASYTFSAINQGIPGHSPMPAVQVNDVINYSEIVNVITVTSLNNYSVNFDYCLALNTKEANKVHFIEIFPNPTSKTLNINSSESFSNIESTIFDVSGKSVSYYSNQINIDVSKLNSGIYFIKVTTDKGEFSQKFIKE